MLFERVWWRVSCLNPTYGTNTAKPSDPNQFERWRNWENWRYGVDFIEEQAGLDFLTNIPKAIQDKLEAKIDGVPSASLLTNPLDEMFFSTGTNSNFQLAPSRLFNILPLSTNSFAEKSSFMSETASNTIQVGGSKIYFRQESTAQVGIAQINSPQLNIPQDGTTQVYLRELPFSPGVSIDQFLNSHNVSHQNTTVSTWIEFLQGTSPFNLNIKITDLPTGQLAEAQITQFSNNGTPTGGILYLRH